MMKHTYEDLCEILEKELSTLTKKGDIDKESLELIDKLTHALKSVKTIVAMEDASYDNGMSRDYSRRNSYDRYNRSYDNSYDGSYDSSYAYRDGRRGRDADNDGRYNESRYSRDNAKDRIMKKLEMLKDDSMNMEDRQQIEKLLHEMRTM